VTYANSAAVGGPRPKPLRRQISVTLNNHLRRVTRSRPPWLRLDARSRTINRRSSTLVHPKKLRSWSVLRRAQCWWTDTARKSLPDARGDEMCRGHHHRGPLATMSVASAAQRSSTMNAFHWRLFVTPGQICSAAGLIAEARNTLPDWNPRA